MMHATDGQQHLIWHSNTDPTHSSIQLLLPAVHMFGYQTFKLRDFHCFDNPSLASRLQGVSTRECYYIIIFRVAEWLRPPPQNHSSIPGAGKPDSGTN